LQSSGSLPLIMCSEAAVAIPFRMWCCRVYVFIRSFGSRQKDGSLARSAAMAADEGRPRIVKVWWHYPKCPMEEDCTVECFKRWKVWGDSEDEAEAQLFRHLTESGKHFLTKELATEMCREHDAVQSHLPMPRSPTPAAADISEADREARKQAIITRRLPKRDDETDRDGGPRQEPVPVKRLRSPPAGRRQIATGEPSASSSSASAASAVVAVPRVMPPQNEPTVTLRMQEFNTIIDSIQRSSQAAKQAGRIAAVASAAFANEATILDEVAANLQTMKAAAEFAAQADR
jgi:hypothetical protein